MNTIEKKMNEVVTLAERIEYTISLEDVQEKYNNTIASHGQNEALNALNETVKTFKTKVKKSDNEKWNMIKNELFSKKGSSPTAIRDLKSMIRDGEIDVNIFNNCEWVKKELKIS